MGQYNYTINMVDISGPLPLEDIAHMFVNAQLPPSTLVCEVGKKGWWPIDAVLQENKLMQPPSVSAASETSGPEPVSQSASPVSADSNASTMPTAADASLQSTQQTQSSASIRRRLQADQPLVPPVDASSSSLAGSISVAQPAPSDSALPESSQVTESPAQAVIPTRPRRRLSLQKVIATTNSLSPEAARSTPLPATGPTTTPLQPIQPVVPAAATPLSPLEQPMISATTAAMPGSSSTSFEEKQSAQEVVEPALLQAKAPAEPAVESLVADRSTLPEAEVMQSPAFEEIRAPSQAAASIQTPSLSSAQLSPAQKSASADPYQIIERAEGKQSSVALLKYNRLQGVADGGDRTLLEKLDLAERRGCSPLQARIKLEDAALITTPGALHFFKGSITMRSSGENVQETASSCIIYEGFGEVYLEPIFGHMTLIDLREDTVVLRQNMFYAAEDRVRVMSFPSPGDETFGEKEPLLRLEGSGWVLLKLPVARSEMLCFTLDNEKLAVDGDSVILCRGAISLSLEMPAPNAHDFSRSQEGILQVFEGHGELWLAPTQKIYKQLV